MTTIADKLGTIRQCKTHIAQAIEAKGVPVTGASFSDYAGLIEQISDSSGCDRIFQCTYATSEVIDPDSTLPFPLVLDGHTLANADTVLLLGLESGKNGLYRYEATDASGQLKKCVDDIQTRNLVFITSGSYIRHVFSNAAHAGVYVDISVGASDVPVSQDAKNELVKKENGLYSTTPVSAQEGNIIEYREDGLFTTGGPSVDLTGYATQSWVENKHYLTHHQDLSAYAKEFDLSAPLEKKKAKATILEPDFKADSSGVEESGDCYVISQEGYVDYGNQPDKAASGWTLEMAITRVVEVRVGDYRLDKASLIYWLDYLNDGVYKFGGATLPIKDDESLQSGRLKLTCFKDWVFDDGTVGVLNKIELFNSDGTLYGEASSNSTNGVYGCGNLIFTTRDVIGQCVICKNDCLLTSYDSPDLKERLTVNVGDGLTIQDGKLVSHVDLTDYATHSWVEDKGYVTQARLDHSLDDFVTRDYLSGSGFLTLSEVESLPVSNNRHPVSSGGVFTALEGKADTRHTHTSEDIHTALGYAPVKPPAFVETSASWPAIATVDIDDPEIDVPDVIPPDDDIDIPDLGYSLTLDVNENTVYSCKTLTRLTLSSLPDSHLETLVYFSTAEIFDSIQIKGSYRTIGELTVKPGKSYVMSILNKTIVLGEVTEVTA